VSAIHNENIDLIKQEMKNKIEQLLIQNENASKSNNRLVCILDRRKHYFQFELIDIDEEENHNSNNNSRSRSRNRNHNNNPEEEKYTAVAEEEQSQEKRKVFYMQKRAQMLTNSHPKCYIYQPASEYGRIRGDFCQEHLFWLSKEYVFPCSMVMENNSRHCLANYGTGYHFNGQMFLLSFCCHSESDVRLYWYFDSKVIRIDDISFFTQMWPTYFVDSYDTDTDNNENENESKDENCNNDDVNLIALIENEFLANWTLPITAQIYDNYKQELLKVVQTESADYALV
jgi:hypothetical protein